MSDAAERQMFVNVYGEQHVAHAESLSTARSLFDPTGAGPAHDETPADVPAGQNFIRALFASSD